MQEEVIGFDDLFFFSSRRRHTRCGRDWSSDVCSSDLCSVRNMATAASSGCSRLREQPLLAAVAMFLTEQWRQSLAQAWLRAGPESDRYAAAVELGDALVRLDVDASRGSGAAVADRLIALQPRLHACHLAC